MDNIGSDKLERHDSVLSIHSMGKEVCRICHCDSTSGELISPCYCSGTLLWVHQMCLQHWIRASNHKNCELCHYPYSVRTKIKPPCDWEALPMTSTEKRRLLCSAIFHSIALGCVMWSLYVLIDRTVDEIHQQELEWQFWTKIVVEAIGCLGAGILIYVWGKSYISLILKWIAFNRTFIIISTNPKSQKSIVPTAAPLCPANPMCHAQQHRNGASNISNSSPPSGTDTNSEKSLEAMSLLHAASSIVVCPSNNDVQSPTSVQISASQSQPQ